MTSLTVQNLLEQTKEAFERVRFSVVGAMVALAKVKAEDAWSEVAQSWGEYVEGELGISQSFASKLLSVHSHYISEGAVSPEKLIGIDYERLYLSAKTGGTIEEQIEKARTLTRSELKAERGEADQHEHQPITICKVCQVRL